jgi:hypothetical protein
LTSILFYKQPMQFHSPVHQKTTTKTSKKTPQIHKICFDFKGISIGKEKEKKKTPPTIIKRKKKKKTNKQNQNLFDTLSKTHLSSNWKGTLTFFFLFRTSLTTPQPSITLKCSQRIWFNLPTLWIFSCLGLPSAKTKLWIFFSNPTFIGLRSKMTGIFRNFRILIGLRFTPQETLILREICSFFRSHFLKKGNI